MNYIKHLSGFFQKISYDTDLNPTHVSLYMALFQTWNVNRFQNPISITRNEMMRISKIYSKATYHKCINDLHTKEYIIYEPSHNPFKGSLIHVNPLETDLMQPSKKKLRKPKNELPTEQVIEHPIEQVVNKHKTSALPTPRQAVVSYINNTNNTNISNLVNESTHEKEMKTKNDLKKKETITVEPKKKKKLREKKESPQSIPPKLEEVKKYFCSQQTDEIEGERFFNHFQSNGWLVGGKSKMYNWQAAANNWILNLQSFKPVQIAFSNPVPGNLKTSNQKKYDEPL
jgi:hypothetical protein